MAYGMFKLFTIGTPALAHSFSLMIAGAIILVLFMILIVKEYEIIK
jgi:uncharacterized integral membrane protein